MRDMFDLNLATIVNTERERDLTADLRARRMLAATSEETAVETAPVRRPVQARAASARMRPIGR
jgi:hypothetical protein